MKNAKQILIPSLTLGLAAAALSVSYAVNLPFTIFVDNTPPPGRDFATTGAVTGANSVGGLSPYTTTLAPNNSGKGKAYVVNTVLFGSLNTVPSTGAQAAQANSATFGGLGDPSSTVQFTFFLQNNAHANASGPSVNPSDAFVEFLVQGYLAGSAGFAGPGAGLNNAAITFTRFDEVDSAFNVLKSGTINGTSLSLSSVPVGDRSYDLSFFPTRSQIGPTNSISLEAFIGPAAVPEPGSIALLLGVGVSGSLLMLRRRK